MRRMHELALFAGAGGGILGGMLLGWRTVCAVEINPFCREVLFRRQMDGILPRFPIWDDVRTFDGKPWRGCIDVISGGFPCQDISAAGQGRGIAGERSGLIWEMLRIVDEIRPAFVFAENSPHLRTKGLATIIPELDRMGYVGRVGVLGARHVGANHNRDRMWVVAYSKNDGCQPGGLPIGKEKTVSDVDVGSESTTNANGQAVRKQSRRISRSNRKDTSVIRVIDWWNLPRFTRMDDGVANRMDRIKATGNGQVPAVAALAWEVLTSDFQGRDR